MPFTLNPKLITLMENDYFKIKLNKMLIKNYN